MFLSRWGVGVWDLVHKWHVDNPRNTVSSMLSGKKIEYVTTDVNR